MDIQLGVVLIPEYLVTSRNLTSETLLILLPVQMILPSLGVPNMNNQVITRCPHLLPPHLRLHRDMNQFIIRSLIISTLMSILKHTQIQVKHYLLVYPTLSTSHLLHRPDFYLMFTIILVSNILLRKYNPLMHQHLIHHNKFST